MERSRRLTERARQLRRNQTPAEEILRRRLRAGRMFGFKFRRQHPIGPHIVDFACVELMIVIELDGDSHADQVTEDAERDEFLEDRGWIVLRFGNDDVEHRLHAVLETIVQVIGRLCPRL